jgi:hypothetical protein
VASLSPCAGLLFRGANIILGMGGASISVLIAYFAWSIIIHVAMLAMFII